MIAYNNSLFDMVGDYDGENNAPDLNDASSVKDTTDLFDLLDEPQSTNAPSVVKKKKRN